MALQCVGDDTVALQCVGDDTVALERVGDDTVALQCVGVVVVARVRHPAGHHGEGGSERLAGQCHLCGELQRRQLQKTAGRPGPEAGEEVRHRPRGGAPAEHSGTGEDDVRCIEAGVIQTIP